MCPGRHFASQETISTLAGLALRYDMEFGVPKAWEPKMNTA